MYAIATLFDMEENAEVKHLWQLLNRTCKLNDIFSTPLPHMTWFGAEELDEVEIVYDIEKSIVGIEPFKVSCSGYGVFTGAKPVIYLSLIKSEKLLRIHKEIWEATYPKLKSPYELYNPEKWIPHITLAYGDVNVNNVGCAIRSILEMESKVQFLIDNVSLIFNKNENIGIYKKIDLRN